MDKIIELFLAPLRAITSFLDNFADKPEDIKKGVVVKETPKTEKAETKVQVAVKKVKKAIKPKKK